MRIINQNRERVLAEEAVLADSFFKRIKGLLGRKELRPGQAMIIMPCNSIHTFFMRFAIDVLFVDKNNVVIAAISDLKPFRLSPIFFQARFTVELPVGTIQSSLTHPGDVIFIT